MIWKFNEAETRFEEIFTLAMEEGPQFITRGTEEAVAISRDEYLQLLAQQADAIHHPRNSQHGTETTDILN